MHNTHICTNEIVKQYPDKDISITKYAAGFAFDNDTLLGIIKNRPEWQAGKLSIPGGHCELNEPPLATCIREFREETGIETTIADWTLFAVLKNDNHQVHFYKSTSIDIYTAETKTDEAVFTEDINIFQPPAGVNNIAWLIQMAKSIDNDRANYFEIHEK